MCFPFQIDFQKNNCKEMQRRIDNATANLTEAQSNIDVCRGEQTDIESKLREASEQMNQLIRERQRLRAKKDETSHKIAELGSVPADAVERYKTFTKKRKLRKELKSITEQLSAYGRVGGCAMRMQGMLQSLFLCGCCVATLLARR